MKKLSYNIIKSIKYIILFAMITLICLSFALTNLIIRPKIDDLINTVVKSKSYEINYFLENRITELTNMSNLYQYELSIDDNLKIIKNYNKLLPLYTSLGIVDEKGFVHTTSDIDFSIEQREYYCEAMNTEKKYIISNSIYSFENNEPIIIILIPMKNNMFYSAAINVEHIIDIVQDNNIFTSSIRIVDTKGNTEVETELFKNNLSIYKSNITVHPFWSLEVGISHLYINSIFYILGIILFITFFTMYLYIDDKINRKISKELSPLENMAVSMKNTDLISGEYIHINTKSLEVSSILNSYNELLKRVRELIKSIEIEQKNRKDSDYQALLEQIKPHFLYNTLETIQVMTLDYDDDKVSESIGLLAKYFRLSLADGKKQVTLQHEINLVKSYIELQKLRYGNLINLTVNKNLNLLDYKVIKFMIQPLVENAIYHGAKLNNTPTEIIIDIFSTNKDLVILVKNKAFNLDKNKINHINECLNNNVKPDGCNGIFNVHQRLLLNYSKPCLSIYHQGDDVIVEIKLNLEKCYGNFDS